MKPAVLYWDNPTPESTSPQTKIWWAPLVPSFQVLPPSSLPRDAGIIAGITYKSFCLAPSIYLRHLLSRSTDLGLKTEVAEIKSMPNLFQLPSCESAFCVINCTGLSAKKLVGDEAMYPMKGQFVIVRGEAERIGIISGGKWESSAIPRPGSGTSALGGCKLAGDWSPDIDEEITQLILQKCRTIAPELLNEDGEFDVLSTDVGLRPSREGGPRVELEWLDIAGGEKKLVCHNYGHSHCGFECSVGAAREAVNLVLSTLGPSEVAAHEESKG